MDILNTIFTIILSLSSGSVITYFSTLRYQRNKVREEVHQEENKSGKGFIENAQDLINLYKTSLDDLAKSYNARLMDYKSKVDDLESKYNGLKEFSDEQGNQIKQLRGLVDKMKLEMESLRRLSEHNCEFCEFKEGCRKYIAMQDQVRSTALQVISK